MQPQERRSIMEQAFIQHYGHPPMLWSQAPGRVDLMGSHTDYNLGYVMTMSIDRDTWIAARPRLDRQVRVFSLNLDSGSSFTLDCIEHDRVTPWTNYVRGVAQILQQEGYTLPGFDAIVHSTIPLSSGLSSSAAIEMATAVVFDALGHLAIDPIQLALVGQRAENEFVGMNCGILDQYSSVLGQAGSVLLLDCRDLSSRSVSIAGGFQVVICDTRARRELTGSEYGQRRAQCEEGVRLLSRYYPGIEALRDITLEQFLAHQDDLPEVVARRCRFILEENQRVLEMADALPIGDLDRIATLAVSSYAGACDLYEICCSEMAAMMEAMMTAPGVIGARQAGAGFGGCMVAFVDGQCVAAFADHVRETYRAATGIDPQVYPTQAAAGAGLLTVPA